MPLGAGSSRSSIDDFIERGGVGSITHLLDDSIWSDLGVRSMPAWMTITADGQVDDGSGRVPDSVLDGRWAS